MAQGRNLENFFGYEQFFFLNGTPIPGVQAIQHSYSMPTTPLTQLGGGNVLISPKGDKFGQVSITAGLVSSDPFYPLTGNLGVNGFVIKDMSQRFEENYGFISGYLTSYSHQYSIGTLPQIQANFQVFSNIGKFNTSHPSSIVSEINSLVFETTGKFQDIHQGCATVSFSEISNNALLGYQIDISCPRIPFYVLNRDTPKHVLLGKPIEIKLTLQIEEGDLSNYNMKGYPYQTEFENISISLKNKNGDTINRYSLGGMQLDSVQKQTSASAPDIRTLIYKKYLA